MKTHALLSLPILTLIFTLSGCVSAMPHVKKKAAFDLNCPEGKIEVTSLGGTSYGAKGCEQQISYTCNMNTVYWPFSIACLK